MKCYGKFGRNSVGILIDEARLDSYCDGIEKYNDCCQWVWFTFYPYPS